MGVSAVRPDGSVAPVLNVVGEAVRRHTGVEPVMVVQSVRPVGDRYRVRLTVEIDTAEDPLDAFQTEVDAGDADAKGAR